MDAGTASGRHGNWELLVVTTIIVFLYALPRYRLELLDIAITLCL